MADLDILKHLSGRAPHWSPQEDYEQSQFDAEEEKKSMEALKSLMQQMPESVSSAGRAPAAEDKKPEITAQKTKTIPKFDPSSIEAKKAQDSIERVAQKIEESLPKSFSMTGKTTEEIKKEAEKASVTSPGPGGLTKEQEGINFLQSQIDALEGEKKKKKQEFESYLDQTVTELTKKPEGMGLLEIVGKSMLALAPGLIGAKLGGYRGGQYAAEGASKALQSLMETEETRRQAAQKIQAEMAKVRASLSKDDIDNLSDFQKELIKGQVDLQTLPLKSQIELQRLLSGKELTKDQTLEYIDKLIELRKTQQSSAEQRAAPRAATGAGAGFTPGQKRLDEKYAESLNEWSTGGGYAGAMEGISRLRQVFEPLRSSDSVTGPIIGRLPIEPPTTAKIRQDIEKTAQIELKRILGSQVTEKEVSAFLQRTFDPKLEESVNLERVERELARLEQIVELKQQQAEYFQKHGSLKGFPFAKKLEELNIKAMSGLSAPSAGVSVKLTKELFDKMSPAQKIEYQNATPAKRQDILKSL